MVSVESSDRSRIIVVLVVVTAASLLIGLVIGGSLLMQDEPNVPPDTVGFTVESAMHAETVVHTFTPDTADSREYRVSYHVWTNPGTTINGVTNQTAFLSASDPFTVEIDDRDPDLEYWIDIQIYDAYDRLIHDSRIGVGI